MTTDVSSVAPACFGAATVFSHDSEICRQCVAFDACSGAAIDTLNAIKHLINVDDLLKRHMRAKKVSRAAIEKADAERQAQQPPGNIEQPLPKAPVERKTPTVAVKIDTTSEEDVILARLPVKPREIAIRLVKKGGIEQMRKDLAEGRNPFDQSGPAFLRVAFALLLAGGFAKRDLREALKNELGWGEGTASSHVGITCALLAAFGFVQESDGRFVLVPASA